MSGTGGGLEGALADLQTVADAHWRAALMLDYLAERIATGGYVASHPRTTGRRPMERCSTEPTEPVCASHGLAQLYRRLAHKRQVPVPHLLTAWTIARSHVRPHLTGLVTPKEVVAELGRAAFACRSKFAPNPRQRHLRAEFASMLASKLASITCGSCARTSYHPGDVASGYCGACHLYEADL